jgi:hypothetical protein
MNKTHIILIGIGGFVVFNLAMIAYAVYAYPAGLKRVFFLSKICPWLFVSKGFAAWIYKA